MLTKKLFALECWRVMILALWIASCINVHACAKWHDCHFGFPSNVHAEFSFSLSLSLSLLPPLRLSSMPWLLLVPQSTTLMLLVIPPLMMIRRTRHWWMLMQNRPRLLMPKPNSRELLMTLYTCAVERERERERGDIVYMYMYMYMYMCEFYLFSQVCDWCDCSWEVVCVWTYPVESLSWQCLPEEGWDWDPTGEPHHCMTF